MRTRLWLSILGAVCAAMLAGGIASPAAEPEALHKYNRGVLIRFEGPITPGLQQYLIRKLETAKAEGADLVVVEIESPGGLVTSSFEIADALRDIHWARTVAYVPRQALSGAAIASLGCDDIIMGSSAVLGDAGAIVMGEDSLFRFAPEKIVSHLSRLLHDLAVAKGRPPALAEAMVDKTLAVYRYENTKTGKTAYMSEREVQGLADAADWKQGPRVAQSGGDRFLEVNGRQAVDLGLAQGLAAGRQQLATRYGLQDFTVLERTGVDIAVDVLNNIWITGLLLVIGLIGLYVEFSSPGIGIGGLIAAVCFAIFFWSHFLGGTAGWLEVVLFLLGIAFVCLELFVFPGFMVAGLSGAVLILISVIMASQSFLIPKTTGDLRTLASTLTMIFLSGVVFALAAAVIGRHFGSLPVLSRLTLEPPDAGVALPGDGGAAVLDGFAPPPVDVGDVGMAQSLLRPGGKARFGDHYVDVVTEGDFITKGSRIRVARVSGNQVVVEEA